MNNSKLDSLLRELKKTYFADDKHLYSINNIYEYCLKSLIEIVIMDANVKGRSFISTAYNTLKLGIIADLMRAQETQLIVHLRQLLGDNEGSSGSKLLKAIKNIKETQYLSLISNGLVVPSYIIPKFMGSQYKQTIEGLKNFELNYNHITTMKIYALKNSIGKFEDRGGYYNKIITEFEKHELHNDRERSKYNINSQAVNGHIIKMIVERRRKNVLDFKQVIKCLDEFADIMLQSIDLSIAPSRFGTSFNPIENYINIFAKTFYFISDSARTGLLRMFKESLDNATRFTCWRVNSYSR